MPHALLTVFSYFNSLGAPSDCADSILEFAYDRQSLCDPLRQPYYFECLQLLAQHRGTERLQMKVAMLHSQDLVSRRDLAEAYRAFNIPLGEASEYSDDRIIDLYQVRQQDLSPAGAEELRQALYKIGVTRQSNRLINASRQSVDTYKDALTWLGNGADESTPDDSLIAIYGAKVRSFFPFMLAILKLRVQPGAPADCRRLPKTEQTRT